MKQVLISTLFCAVFGLCVSGCLDGTKSTKVRQVPCSGKEFHGKCVVTFFLEDGSRYISEQTHKICPDFNRIAMSAVEPEGNIQWELREGNFQSTAGGANIPSSTVTVINRSVAKAILTNVSADPAPKIIEESEKVKIDGQWYRVIEVAGSSHQDFPSQENIKNKWAETVLYADADTGIVKRVSVYDVENDVTATGIGFNFQNLEGIGDSVPTKIDVFLRKGKGMILGRRTLQVNYYRTEAF